MAQSRPVNADTVALVKEFEGIPGAAAGDIRPYKDPIDIWTIGWGHVIIFDGHVLKGDADLAKVKQVYPDGISLQRAEALLDADLEQTGNGVLSMVTVSLSDNQYGALTSFAFNLGLNNLRTSTLLKKLNVHDMSGAAEQFPRWSFAQGKLMQGLLKRRNAERTLFLKP